MIKSISQKPKPEMLSIDLTGPEGNAFYLIGYAKKIAKSLVYEEQDIQQLVRDMTSSDYENLLDVFDKHFGAYVILYR